MKLFITVLEEKKGEDSNYDESIAVEVKSDTIYFHKDEFHKTDVLILNLNEKVYKLKKSDLLNSIKVLF